MIQYILKHILANLFFYILTVSVYVECYKSVTRVSWLCLEQSPSVHDPLSLHPSPMSLCPTSQNSWKQSIVMISGLSDSLDPIISLPGERRWQAGGERSSQHSLFWHYAEVRHHLGGELGWPSFIYCNSGLWPGELSGKQHLWKKGAEWNERGL